MPAEKIYYAIVVLLCAVSMLLSPLFMVRRGRVLKVQSSHRTWKTIIAANLLMIMALIFVWKKYL